MSQFDGTDEPLSYGQALVELARVASFRTEGQRASVVKAIEIEHGIYVQPQEEKRADEIARLAALVAEKEKADKDAAEASQLAALRTRLGLDPETGLPVLPSPEDPAPAPVDTAAVTTPARAALGLPPASPQDAQA